MKPWMALLIMLMAAPAFAGLPDLAPLTAQYRITLNGIPLGTPATVTIRALGGSRYEAGFSVENRLMTHQEMSRFDWQNCHVIAREYLHEFHGFRLDRQSALTFNQERQIAIEARDGKSKELPITPDIVDALNMAMLARCRLRDGVKRFNFSMIYRGEYKELDFEVIGEEKINTRLGTFNALIVERRYPQRGKRTRIWVAPDLDWFMVRFEHVENPLVRGSLILTHLIVEKDLQASDSTHAVKPEKTAATGTKTP